jgi:hypothetical protein
MLVALRRRAAWRLAVGWAVAVLLALAPLAVQASVAHAVRAQAAHAAGHGHDHAHHQHAHAGHAHGSHAHHTPFDLTPAAAPDVPHDSTNCNLDVCCGAFCHTVMAMAAPAMPLPPAPPESAVPGTVASLYGEAVPPSLPPPKPVLSH